MNEQKAREIIKNRFGDANTQELSDTKIILDDMRYGFVYWEKGRNTVNIEDNLTADQLEAIAWWVKNKGNK